MTALVVIELWVRLQFTSRFVELELRAIQAEFT
jgi:hypothetical protein